MLDVTWICFLASTLVKMPPAFKIELILMLVMKYDAFCGGRSRMVEKRQRGERFINLRPIKNCHKKLMTTGAVTDRKKHTDSILQ